MELTIKTWNILKLHDISKEILAQTHKHTPTVMTKNVQFVVFSHQNRIWNIYKRKPRHNEHTSAWISFPIRSVFVANIFFLQAAFLTCFSSWNRWWKSKMAIEYFKRSTEAKLISFLFLFAESKWNGIALKMTTKWNEQEKKRPKLSPFVCFFSP